MTCLMEMISQLSSIPHWDAVSNGSEI